MYMKKKIRNFILILGIIVFSFITIVFGLTVNKEKDNKKDINLEKKM